MDSTRRTIHPDFSLQDDSFVIKNYNQARPFSSFLPGIAGQFGKPMWVFYINRGQCISSFGVRDKDGAMLEFNPATKAYQETPLTGFRTFLRVRQGRSDIFYEPFIGEPHPSVRQTLTIRAHEIVLEETHKDLGLVTTVIAFTVPNEEVPLLARDITFRNIGRKPIQFEVLDGLPRVVPFDLQEKFLKQMARTMEAFSEILHVLERLPFFKMKVEPDDKPDVHWVKGGSFTFSVMDGKSLPIRVDPDSLFGSDTTFLKPRVFLANRRFLALPQRTEALFGSAFSFSTYTLKPGTQQSLQTYYGQADGWETASALRERILSEPAYASLKREENAWMIRGLTESLALHSGTICLDAYSRQTYLDNTLRGGEPFLIPRKSGNQVFHIYSRKHGDLERDYNFFEISPTYFSQGNGNYRDVNQNRRSEVLLHPGMNSGNVETFFNLLQLDGYNPLVIKSEKFYLDKDQISGFDADLTEFLSTPFSPGALFARLLALYPQREEAYEHFLRILSKAKKIQDAAHGEGFWVDHWTYNLDLLENLLAVYPEEAKQLLIARRDFTYYDNYYVVQPRHKKYQRRADGRIRQLDAVVLDSVKQKMIRSRPLDPHKVRTKNGEGAIYQTTLFVKILGLIAMKAATLDPFGVGIEMEADKPGWCDALNGLPGLLGSSVNETFELRRWVMFLQSHLPQLLGPGETHPLPIEMVEFFKAVGEALAISRTDDFYKTWDTLASLRERFRERTRMGLIGEETPWSREETATFLSGVARALEAGLKKAMLPNGMCLTYFINEPVRYELLTLIPATEPDEEAVQTVKVLEFKQTPVSPFLEGPMHALRTVASVDEAKRIYQAVKTSELYDRKLKMFKLNVPLTKESYEIGRNKIFTPGWLENESVFLHMSYKFLLEELRSGLVDSFFDDLKHQCVAFLDPAVYGRSPLENSSFIVSSRFPDARLHGAGFSARLTGAAAEWISIILYMGLGPQPFQVIDGQLRFEPRPTLASWLFERKASDGFEKDTFGFKLFGRTWLIYHNPSRRNTFGSKPLAVKRYRVRYPSGQEWIQEGAYLPEARAQELRAGKLDRVTIDLG